MRVFGSQMQVMQRPVAAIAWLEKAKSKIYQVACSNIAFFSPS